jgi:hypothetical protein
VLCSERDTDARMKDKRTGMWWRMAEAVKERRLAIPAGCDRLASDLVIPQYSYVQDQLVLENSERIRQRAGRSLDFGSALGHTFVTEVAPPGVAVPGFGPGLPPAAALWAPAARAAGIDYQRRRHSSR